jgi:short-subunit dehydrogenase
VSKSKRVVITGASTGIGHATARALAKKGHSLVLVARRADLLLEVARECLELGAAAATAAPLDLGEPSQATRLADHLQHLPAGEQVLVNNAGVAQFGDFATSSWIDHSRQIEVNLLGLMASTHALLPGMLADGSGLIVNVLSIAATHVFPGAEAYSASKAGALAFGRSLSASYRRQGIRVTQILPGATDTPIWGEGGPDRNQMLSPDAVARVIRDVVEASPDRVMDEVTVTPPFGIL